MTQLTEEQLESVYKLSQIHFSLEEIAIFLDVELIELKLLASEKNNNFYKTLMKGRLKTEVILRETILQDAKNGSSPAQSQFISIIQKTKLKDLN